ncbi:MAG: 4-hydroxy-tetrahydrodipicolinate reductase [Bacteroidaceae bacterium]|nr:4-hydroxy-tetrahydrodipicolinate reductase [Bacteroidaceae bacterium]
MKIALIGYGKMGRMIEQTARQRGHDIVCRIDIDNQQDFDSEAFRTADVAIEFTAPAVAYGNVCRCFDAGVKVVSGSTGWMQHHGDDVRRACQEQGRTLFWSSNFSVGVYIFNTINRQLARIMNSFPQYAPRMEETHHIHKLDHPSGTAITLAETIVDEVERVDAWRVGTLTQPDGSTVAPQPGDDGTTAAAMPIDSIRRGEVPGIHSITWDSDADQITITHDAHSRQGFALGAVLAAEYAATHSGLLTMDDMFHFDI